MRKISRFGAAALALALTVTFVTPTTALAAKKSSTSKTPNAVEALGRQGNDTIGITKNVTLIGEYTGTEDDNNSAYMNASNATRVAGLAGGWLKTDRDATNYPIEWDLYNADDRTWQSYYVPNGYDYDYEYTTVYGADKDSVKMTVTSTAYTNNSTGKTSTDEDDIYDEASQQLFVSGVRIKTGETTYLAIPLRNGDVNIKDLKSSKKKVIAAERFTKKDSVYDTNRNVSYSYDADGNAYYYSTTGQKVILADKNTAVRKTAAYLTSNASYATVYVKLTPKKVGKSVLSFNIVNKQGVVTGSVKTTVYAVKDTSALKTFSFGGKSLLDDYSNSKNFNYGKRADDTEWNVATKNSGKLVVKANKNFQIKKIEVGTLYTEARTAESSYDYENTATGLTTTHKLDLNGDGDTLDTVNGISESNVSFKYKTVKSGKKITLGSTGYDQSYTYTSSARYNGTSYSHQNEDKSGVKSTATNNGFNFYAPTSIKVTIYDKLSKTYTVEYATIYRKVKK